jgi:hypothetical protein
VCTGCVQTWGSSHEESDSDCIGFSLAVIFGYVVGDVVAHLLEKFWWQDHWERDCELGAQLLNRTGRQ